MLGMGFWLMFAATLGARGAQEYDVALLRPSTYLQAKPSAGTEVYTYFQNMRAALRVAGVTYHTVEESALTEGKVHPGEILICPYNPEMPSTVAAAVGRFVDQGGRVFLCYFAPDPLRDRLGLGPLTYRAEGEEGLFATLRATSDAPPGAPRQVAQGSWNAFVPASVDAKKAKVAMEWLARDGKTVSGPGLVTAGPLAWMGHVMTPGDTDAKAQMMLAVLGAWEPRLWKQAVNHAVRPELGFRYAPDLPALVKLAAGKPAEAKAKAYLEQMDDLRRDAGKGRPWEAFAAALKLRAEAEDVYLSVLPSRADKMRAAWVVSVEGVSNWGWEETAQVAKECGLTDLFVRVEWGGQASYPSQVLPSRVKGPRDPVAEGIAACHKYGLRYHAWFINLNWRTPSQEIIDHARANNWWQIAPDGQDRVDEDGERVYWLNPAEPGVVELQAKMMAEVAAKYPVDGVQFDYIRYENYGGSYGPQDRQRFEAWAGVKVSHWPADVLPGDKSDGPLHDKFCEWRCEQVSNLVRACAEACRAARPGVKVSAAVYPSWPAHRKTVGQDWVRWLKQGWIDFVCPMTYDSPENFDRHVDRVRRQREACGDKMLISGIGAWLHPGAVTVAESIVADRELGVDGIALFSFTPQLGRDVLPALRRGVFAEDDRGRP
jgi:uncharacterized lipoprotein YddW (UPF0748 family)